MTKINGAGTRQPGMVVNVEFYVSPMTLVAAVAEKIHDFCSWHGIDLSELDAVHATSAFADIERRHILGALASHFTASGTNITWNTPAHRYLFDAAKAVAAKLFPDMFPGSQRAAEVHRHSA